MYMMVTVQTLCGLYAAWNHKKYVADYDEELVKMGKVNEGLLHITTDLTYVTETCYSAEITCKGSIR